MTENARGFNAEPVNDEKATFCLVHGAFHGPWCWDFIRPYLEERGHPTIAPNLPIEDPGANFNRYADVVSKEISASGAKEVYVVGHSRAGNVVPRLGNSAIKKLVYIAASIEEHTIGRPLVEEVDKVPHKNSLHFLAGSKNLGGEMTAYEKSLAKEIFYQDCPDEVAEWAADQLRIQRKSRKEPSISEMPTTTAHFIVCAFDRVVNPDRQIYTALNWFNVPESRIHVFASGHSPMLAKPREFAEKLLEWTADTKDDNDENS